MGRHYQLFQTNEDHFTRMETLSEALKIFHFDIVRKKAKQDYNKNGVTTNTN